MSQVSPTGISSLITVWKLDIIFTFPDPSHMTAVSNLTAYIVPASLAAMIVPVTKFRVLFSIEILVPNPSKSRVEVLRPLKI